MRTSDMSNERGAGWLGHIAHRQLVNPRDSTRSESKRDCITYLEQGIPALRLFIRTPAEAQGHLQNPQAGVRRS
jgi:hypothetical protein